MGLWNSFRLIKPNPKQVPNPKIVTHTWPNHYHRGMLTDTRVFEIIKCDPAFWLMELSHNLCRSLFQMVATSSIIGFKWFNWAENYLKRNLLIYNFNNYIFINQLIFENHCNLSCSLEIDCRTLGPYHSGRASSLVLPGLPPVVSEQCPACVTWIWQSCSQPGLRPPGRCVPTSYK